MKINELKLNDRVKVMWSNGNPRYGNIFSLHDYYQNNNPNCLLVLFDGEAWARSVPKAGILCKIETSEIPIEHPITSQSFSLQVVSLNITQNIFEDLGYRGIAGAETILEGDSEKGKVYMKVPFIFKLNPNKKIKVTLEELT